MLVYFWSDENLKLTMSDVRRSNVKEMDIACVCFLQADPTC